MKLDFNALAQRLLLGSETLVPQWLPGGRRRGHEWVCGDLSGGEGTSLSRQPAERPVGRLRHQ
jgi:putative DNA primase/helicase